MIDYENLSLTNNIYKKFFLLKLQSFFNKGNYILSNNVRTFEKNFSKYLKVSYCTGVANGLEALIIALESLNLPKDSEVIVAANTYYASVLAIIKAGLKPVLVEPEIDTYNIDCKEIIKKINKNTKIILAVHLYGKVCNMDHIKQICIDKKLFLIEDCAQSHGAKFKNQHSGTFGDFGCFSFYPTKNLGALGDAGAVVTNKKENDRNMRLMRNYGSIERYNNEIIGSNSRLDEIQALFLNIKLKYLNKINKHKRNLADIYYNNLKDYFIKPKLKNDYYDVYYAYVIRCDKRDLLKEFLRKNGILTDIHYPKPLYRQKALKNYFKDPKFPITDKIHETILSLPISVMHSKKMIEKICKIINRF